MGRANDLSYLGLAVSIEDIDFLTVTLLFFDLTLNFPPLHYCGDVLADFIYLSTRILGFYARSSLLIVMNTVHMLDDDDDGDYSTESAGLLAASLEGSDQLAAAGRTGSMQTHLAA